MVVGQGDGLLTICGIGSGVGVALGHIHFFHAIIAVDTLGLLDQAGPGVGPVVGFIQLYSFALCDTVFSQPDHNGSGPDAILVLSIVPGLGDGDRGTGQSAGNTGNRECQLGAVSQSQVSLLVSGEGLALFKVLILNIQFDGVGVSIGVSSGIAAGGNLSIAQVPGVGIVRTGNEVITGINHGDHISHGVGNGQTSTVQTLGDGLGDCCKCCIQLSRVVSIIGTAGGSDLATQELTDGRTIFAKPAVVLISDIISDTEADGIQISTLALDLACTVSSSSIVSLAAGRAITTVDAVGRNTVGQQDNALGTGNRIQQSGALIQATFQVGTTIGTHAIDSSDSSIVRILTCTASHIDPIQFGGVVGCKSNDGQHTACRSIGTGIFLQKILCSGLCCSHAASALRATGVMPTAGCTAVSAVCHRAGHVHNQNNSTAIGNSRSGLGCLHLQGDLKLVVAKSLCGLGQGNTIVISNGTGTAFGPSAIAILTIGGSFSSRCGCGHYGQHEAGRQQDAEDFLQLFFHNAYLVIVIAKLYYLSL